MTHAARCGASKVKRHSGRYPDNVGRRILLNAPNPIGHAGLGRRTPSFLGSLNDEPDPRTTVHLALLTLAKAPPGMHLAYRNLQDEQSLQAMVSAAIAARDADQIRACAGIETFVHDRAFTGALHRILAWLLRQVHSHIPNGSVHDLHSPSPKSGVK